MTWHQDIAIVDYGMGNLFSVAAACSEVGLTAVATSEPQAIEQSAAVILPGVGAFGEAMSRLREKSLDDALLRFVRQGRPFLAICLGMQLLFEESEEFGTSSGLGLLPGRVVRFPGRDGAGVSYKVPTVGWNRVRMAKARQPCAWHVTPMAGIDDGEYFYFVHSYYVQPDDPNLVVTTTNYCGVEYVSSVAHESIFACQFHPERSGRPGLQVYRNLAATLRRGE